MLYILVFLKPIAAPYTYLKKDEQALMLIHHHHHHRYRRAYTTVGVRCHSLSEPVLRHETQLQQVRSAGLLHTIDILKQLDRLVRKSCQKSGEGMKGNLGRNV